MRKVLRDVPVPQEREAEERGWRVVRAAFDALPATQRQPGRIRWLVALAAGLLILAIGLSPAGAKVADLVGEVIHPGEEKARPKLTSLPTAGRLLVTSPQGAWVVAEDGAKRLLGGYEDATWSPRGMFVAVAKGHELTAVEPDGTVRWSLTANRPVSDPVWAPSGIRIAYRAGKSVRVVAGNATDDHLLARRAAPTPPAWAPDTDRNVLAFVDPNGRVRAVDVESGQTLWRSARFGGPVQSLQWSSTGRLLVMARSFFVTLDARGEAIAKGPIGGSVEAAAFSPDANLLALARRTGARSELELVRTGSAGSSQRRLIARPGRFTDIAWSPDGTWILIAWRDADQWLFIRPDDGKIIAVSDISRQFAPGGARAGRFPRVAGWCCAP